MATPPLPVWSLQRIAGVCTWLVVGLPLILERLSGPVPGNFSLWLTCFLAFGVLEQLISEPRLDNVIPHKSLVPLLLLTLLAIGVIVFGDNYDLGSILLIITAAYAAHLLPLKNALLYVALQTLARAAQ